MTFKLDPTKIQYPAPGSFEANILRMIEVPFQTIDNSGGQSPAPGPHDALAMPAITINWDEVSKIPVRLRVSGDSVPS